MSQNITTDAGSKAFSNTLVKHPECWLKFSWSDVRYIIVPDDEAVKGTIKQIMELQIEENEKYLLLSKIETSKRFADNM